jgi:myosin heavy subunit
LYKGEPFNDIAKEIRTALVEIEKFDRAAVSTSKAYAELTKNATKTVQSIQQVTHAQSESAKLMSEALAKKEYERKLLVEENKIKAEIAKQQARENKEREKAIKVQRDQNSEYKKLSDNTRRLKNESKDLGAQLLKLEANGQRNTKAYRDLAAQYRATTQAAQAGDTQLKKLDKTVGDNFRNVGNYQSALGGLKNVLGQLGLAMGAGAIARDVFGVIKDFGQANQTLAAILGTTADQTENLQKQQKQLGASTSFTAAQVAELQTELAKLGFTQEQIEQSTEGVLMLAKAAGTDLANASAIAGSTLRGFGLEANEMGRVTDVMAKSFSTSALDIEKFKESMKLVAPIAATAGVSLEEATAMLGSLANAGISGSNAGTALRRILSEVAATGKPVKEAFKEMAERGMDVADANDEVGKNAASALLILNKSTEGTDALTETYKNAAGSAKEMSEVMDDSVSGALDRLRSAYEGLILDMNDATGAGNSFKNALNFLANNLGTIFTVLGKVVKAFLAYKAVMFGLKMKDRIAEMISYNKALKNGTVTAEGATSSVKKFGAALKGIGIGLAIGLALELAQAFYKIASGAQDAERRVDNLNQAVEKGSKIANTRLDFLRDEVALRNITLEQQKELIRQEVISLKNQKASLAAMATQLAASDAFRSASSKNPVFRSLGDIQQIAKMETYKNKLAEIDASLMAYNEELKNVRISEIQMEEATASSTDAIKDKSKEVDNTKEKLAALQAALRKTTDEYKKLAEVSRLSLDPDEVEKALALEHERKVLAADIAVIEAEIALSKAMQSGDAKKIEAAEKAVLEAKKEQIKAQLKLDLSTTDNVNEREKLIKQAELDELNLTKTVTETYKERFDTMRNIQQAITDVLQEQIDRRIELLGQEADAAKSQQDYLTQLAANGNIYAQQSIAEQIEIQREAQAEQMRLERQKQNIELISQGLSTFNSELASGKSAPQALASTIVSTQALVGFLKNLNFFAKGTDNAPEGLAVVDEQGAEIITDSKGRIKDVGSNQGARFVNLKKGDKVLTATKTAQILESFGNVTNGQAMTKADKVGNSYDIMALNSGLNRIENAIKNKPEYTVHWDTYGAVERVRKGGDIVTNRYRK